VSRERIGSLATGCRAHVAVFVLFVFLSCGFTFPLVLHLGDTVRDPGDPLLNSWILAWDVHKLTSNPKGFFDANIFYPHPQTLAYSEHMFASALLAFPFIVISGNPLLGHNAVLLLSFILTGFTTYLLVRELTDSTASGIIAGLIFAFAPYRFAQLSHLQLLTIQWLPLTFLFLRRFLLNGKIHTLILFFLFFNLQALSSYYLALQMILGMGMYVIYRFIVDPQVRRIKYLGGLGLAALFSLGVNLPFALPYIELASIGQVRLLSESEGLSAQLMNYLAAPSENLLYGKFTAAFQGTCGMECALFPGLTSVILALGGLWLAAETRGKERKSWGDQRFYLIFLVVAFILTLGPYYHLGEDFRIPLPYQLFYHYFPGFKAMRVPARFGMTVMFALAVLAGYGMRAFQEWVKRKRVHVSYRVLLYVLPIILVVGEFSVVPGTTTTYSFPGKEVPPVYRWLASLKESVAIVELPMLHDGYFPLRAEFQYTYYSAFHWQKTVNGWSGFLPPLFWELYDGLRSFPDPWSLTALQGVGVDYAIVHADKVGPGKLAGILALASEGGPLEWVGRFGAAYVFQVRANAYKDGDVPAALHTSLLVPSQAQVGRKVTLAVSLQNRGSKPLVFYPAEKGHLRVLWEEGNNKTSHDFRLPLVILPGESVPVSVTIPSLPGEGWRTVSVDVDVAGLGIHRSLQGKTQLGDGNVLAGSLSGHSAVEYQEVQSPSWVETREGFPVVIRVRNVGGTIWHARTPEGESSEEGEVYLRVPAWLDERGKPIAGSAFRSDLPHDVAPGDEAEITLKVQAPLRSGDFQMQVEMAGGSTPFVTEKDKPLLLPIKVISTAPALAAVGEEVAMAVRGEDGRVWVNKTQGGEWVGWERIGEAPSWAEDKGIWVNRTAGEKWQGWNRIDEASSAPVQAIAGGEMVVISQGEDSRVRAKRLGRSVWEDAPWIEPMPPLPLRVVSTGGEIIVVQQRRNGVLWVNRFGREGWKEWERVPAVKEETSGAG